MSEGWYCPACAAHHAPDVKTCPSARESELERLLRNDEIPVSIQPDGSVRVIADSHK